MKKKGGFLFGLVQEEPTVRGRGGASAAALRFLSRRGARVQAHLGHVVVVVLTRCGDCVKHRKVVGEWSVQVHAWTDNRGREG